MNYYGDYDGIHHTYTPTPLLSTIHHPPSAPQKHTNSFALNPFNPDSIRLWKERKLFHIFHFFFPPFCCCCCCCTFAESKRERTLSIGSRNATPLTKLVLSWFLLSTMTYPHKLNYSERICRLLSAGERIVWKLWWFVFFFDSFFCSFSVVAFFFTILGHQHPASPLFRIGCLCGICLNVQMVSMNSIFPSFVWLFCLDPSNENFVPLRPTVQRTMNKLSPVVCSSNVLLSCYISWMSVVCKLGNCEIQNAKPSLILRIWIASHFNIFHLENYVSSLTLQCFNEIQQLSATA